MSATDYSEDDLLQLSGIQHFAFCRRQWALIHIEKQWSENYLTASGSIVHEKAHDSSVRERRGDMIISRAMPVRSFSLGLSGECDVVEFTCCESGIPINGLKGLWSICPVEYKRGSMKTDDCDRLQLAAQVICLEEMFACDIPSAFLFYNKTHRRESVEITDELREKVKQLAAEMHKYFSEGYTPQGKVSKKCTSCSLCDLCLPELQKCSTVSVYISAHIDKTGDAL